MYEGFVLIFLTGDYLRRGLPDGLVLVHPPEARTYPHAVEPLVDVPVFHVAVEFSDGMQSVGHGVKDEASVHEPNQKNVAPFW